MDAEDLRQAEAGFAVVYVDSETPLGYERALAHAG